MTTSRFPGSSWALKAMSRSSLAELDLWRLFSTMTKIRYAGYRFPPEIIQQAIWLYLRFTLSLRDIEDLLAEWGIMVSYSYCVITSYGASLCRQAWRSMGIAKVC
jgi:hypothetical protein